MNGFEKWFSKATQRFEKSLFKLAVFMILLVIFSQYLMTFDTIRRIINPVDRLEGERIEQVFQPEYTHAQADLYIELVLEAEGEVEPGLVKVLVNQVEKAVFRDRRVLLQVKEGDMIEIDGQELGEPVTIRIIEVHGSVKTPLVGHAVTTFGTNELLGWVTM